MIVSSLEHADAVLALHPALKSLFEFVKAHDCKALPLGRNEIDGDRLYVNHAHNDAVKAEEQKLEVHRRYIDVHILLEGSETIGWKDLADTTGEVHAYDAEGDFALYADRPAGYVTLHPGQFLIAMPEDAHAPLIGEGKIDKLIAKVLI